MKKFSNENTQKLVRESLSLIEAKLYQKAKLNLHQAYKTSPDEMSLFLAGFFEQKIKEEDYELAQQLGEILALYNPNEPNLLNKLGHCARKLGALKDAQILYYTAFNIQNSFELAILNHAATVLNIDLYDLEIRELFENNIRSKNFHLPEYL
ncbi:MAG: hypothetical protein OEY59_04450, partial [Deltaproteobacteria bacterium]|nr:hypothetical protein [Deltaproteobacteria bacterium]